MGTGQPLMVPGTRSSWRDAALMLIIVLFAQWVNLRGFNEKLEVLQEEVISVRKAVHAFRAEQAEITREALNEWASQVDVLAEALKSISQTLDDNVLESLGVVETGLGEIAFDMEEYMKDLKADVRNALQQRKDALTQAVAGSAQTAKGSIKKDMGDEAARNSPTKHTHSSDVPSIPAIEDKEKTRMGKSLDDFRNAEKDIVAARDGTLHKDAMIPKQIQDKIQAVVEGKTKPS